MNKSKKLLNHKRNRKEEEESESEAGSDEELSEEVEKESSPKVSKSSKKQVKKSEDEDDNIIVGKDEITFKLNMKKRVNVRKFKGSVLVDIREFWMDDSGNWKPGKKGISLTEDVWKKLKNYSDDIDTAIKNMK